MSTIELIGTTAGAVWRFLSAAGPSTLYAIEKGIDAPKSSIAMAIGWLAREGKLHVEYEGRTVRYALRG
jgi:Winged helix-turn-helix domain (DUF2582)